MSVVRREFVQLWVLRFDTFEYGRFWVDTDWICIKNFTLISFLMMQLSCFERIGDIPFLSILVLSFEVRPFCWMIPFSDAGVFENWETEEERIVLSVEEICY